MADRPLDARDAHTSDHMSARNQGAAEAMCGKPRRRWTAEQKRQIVAESMAPGTSVATVARKHGVSGGQVYAWPLALTGIDPGLLREVDPPTSFLTARRACARRPVHRLAAVRSL